MSRVAALLPPKEYLLWKYLEVKEENKTPLFIICLTFMSSYPRSLSSSRKRLSGKRCRLPSASPEFSGARRICRGLGGWNLEGRMSRRGSDCAVFTTSTTETRFASYWDNIPVQHPQVKMRCRFISHNGIKAALKIYINTS